jgi:thiosulfate/3-mercaptopyruvate sulfurtransferase
MYETLISANELAALLTTDPPVLVDCRFDLMASDRGPADYLAGHIPGAVYAHLVRHLSGPPTTDQGRHPLPTPARLQTVFGALGIDGTRQVVAYDDAQGSYAARLWWLLRYMSHWAVAVLDGGWQAWRECGCAIEVGPREPHRVSFAGTLRPDRRVLIGDLRDGDMLVDARDPVRYRGEREPIDPRAGHIPGARNHFWQRNLAADGCFLAPPELREAFRDSLGTLPDTATIHYCGSGVSACHNVLAQVHAGLAEPRVYCGSWSEWCRDPARPAALGPSPGGD